MLVIYKGFEYEVSDKNVLGQLLKHGAVLVQEKTTEEVKVTTKEEILEEATTEKPIRKPRKK